MDIFTIKKEISNARSFQNSLMKELFIQFYFFRVEMMDRDLNDTELYNINEKQWLKKEESQPRFSWFLQAELSKSLQAEFNFLQKLGLSETVIDFTMESLLGPNNHQCNMYFVKRSMREVVRSSPQENRLAILKLCFQEAKAKELEASLVENDLLKHDSLENWMYLYLEYTNNQLNNKQRFPNNEQVISQWFSSEANVKTTPYKILCINIDSKNVQSFPTNNSTFSLSTEGANYWYHGTTQAVAEDIRNWAIVLGDGRSKQDFSHSNGFYLNPKFDDAKEWAFKRFNRTTGAVLIYKFSLDGFKGLNLFNQPEKWKIVVEYFRKGCRFVIPDNVEEELDRVDYIIGPISTGPPNTQDQSWEPLVYHGKSQLCIKSANMAKRVSLELQGIIYFSD